VLVVLAGMATWLASGCGSSGPEVIHVTGTVLYEGKPLEDATVVFSPKWEKAGAIPLALATTDAEGRFRLRTKWGSTNALNGAVPGEHRVTISKFVLPPGMTEEEYEKRFEAEKKAGENRPYDAPVPEGIIPSKTQLLGPEYSDSQKTTLLAVVKTDGKNDFTFELE